MARAKTMNRSRNQIATAYAPESFFTFEGGSGACISRSAAGEPVTLLDSTRAQIVDRFEEFGLAWFQAGMRARDANAEQRAKAPILAEQVVDPMMLDEERQNFRLPGIDRIYFCKPSQMGYTPAPLAFVCRYCDLFRDYASLRDFAQGLTILEAHPCTNPRAPNGVCSWEQLDVIFVHWSGHWTAPTPYMWDYRNGAATLITTPCLGCGGFEFKLSRESPRIGEWRFLCADPKCGQSRGEWWLNDQETLDILKTKVGEGRLAGPTEVRMEVTPYRASNAYYVQAELFIDFKDGTGTLAGLLRPGAEAELADFIARTYGFESIPISDDEVEQACRNHPEELSQFKSANATIRDISAIIAGMPQSARAALEGAIRTARDSRDQVLARLRERRILQPKVALPSAISAGIMVRRSMFAPRFDPYRLAVEHAMLKQTRLDVTQMVGGKRAYVSFTQLDNDLAAETPEETTESENLSRLRLQQLGLADMGLIREFELCRFSFGYSRMQSNPVLHGKRGMDMPVRLRLFPPVMHDTTMKHPIYVVQQANQAIYVRLDQARVLAWLGELDCADMFTLKPGETVGAGALEIATPMNRFLEGLPKGSPAPNAYLYLYTLLHSYAHAVMKQISEYSGLDLGSLGEYVFPADLAFVIYRNGTTMDLGNLSAMWRNAGQALLSCILDPRSAQCGTGSLCTLRGRACPDCLMVPETSCLASNKLLSRAVLRSIGGRVRQIDQRPGAIRGYLDTVGVVA